MQVKLSQCCSGTGLLEWLLFQTRQCEMVFGNKNITGGAKARARRGCLYPVCSRRLPQLRLNCSQCITRFSISFPFLGATSALCFPFKLIEIKYLSKCHGHLEISHLFTLPCFHSVHLLQYQLLKP